MFHLKRNQCDVNLNDNEMPILVNQISKDFLTYAIPCLFVWRKMVLTLTMEWTLVQFFLGASWYYMLKVLKHACTSQSSAEDRYVKRHNTMHSRNVSRVIWEPEAEIIQVINCSREAKVISQQRWLLDRFGRSSKSSPRRENNFRSSQTSGELHITTQKHGGMDR